MLIKLNVACGKEGQCDPCFVPIEEIYSVSKADDEDDNTVHTIVKLENGEEYKCTDELSYYDEIADCVLIISDGSDDK